MCTIAIMTRALSLPDVLLADETYLKEAQSHTNVSRS